MKKKLLSAALLAGALLVPSMAYADEPAAAADAPNDYIMMGAESAGLKPALDDAHIKVYGWIEAGYTMQADSPTDRVVFGRAFDGKDNHFGVNQLALRVERTLSDGNGFDFGGLVELWYGTDAKLVHSNGLMNHEGPTLEYQFDPVNFYGLIRFPVGEGLTLKFGKFDSPIGAEVKQAPYNALYSHSYLFMGEPANHTGFQFDYPLIKDTLNVYAGANLGWNQFKDNNDQFTALLGAYGKLTDKLSYNLNITAGPEKANETTDMRTFVEGILSYALTDELTLTADVNYFNERHDVLTADGSFSDGSWWGVAGYATYKVCSQANVTLRAEYFDDHNGIALGNNGGAATVPLLGRSGSRYTELTLGLDLYPIEKLRNIRFRPEVRWDHAFDLQPFNSGELHNQVTIGGDLIFTF